MKLFRNFASVAPLIAIAVLIVACDGSSNNNNRRYSADIVWTEFGIPHISANSWGNLGFGTGYAFARENYCVGMQGYVIAAGDTARYFAENGNLQQDLFWKFYNSDERIEEMLDSLSDEARQLFDGYAAGFNKYLEEIGIENLPEACRGAAWVREVDASDLMRVLHRLVLFTSGEALLPFIAAAPPPPEAPAMAALPSPEAAEMLAKMKPEDIRSALNLPEESAYGSNGYVIGGESTQTGYGIILSNPHLPWDIPLRYFMARQTLGDELDIMGVTLFGLPAIGTGFNENMAWGVTVSTSSRFSLYELELNPDNPLQYVYDGEFRDLEPVTVSAEQLTEAGTVESVERTFYLSQYGPVVNLGALLPPLDGWPNAFGTLLVYRDANLANARTMDQWIAFGKSQSAQDIKEATPILGQPYINTLATDRSGDAFFGNISVSANISDAQLNGCVRGLVQGQLTASGFITLDGSDSFCEWGTDEGAPDGLFSFDSLPKLDTRDYAANSNDSHWLANPRNLLEGFPMSVGLERIEQRLRPRQTFDQAERRLAGTDDLGDSGFNIDNIRSIMYGATNYTADLVIEDVVGICESVEDWSVYSANPMEVAESCDVLSNWDRTYLITSVGSHIFWEFWQIFSLTENIWAVPFDESDPVNTPRDLNVADEAVVESVKASLAAATDKLVMSSIPLNAAWGDLQYVEKNGIRYPIHGGPEPITFSVITSPLVPGEGYNQIELGNSFIQAVTWDQSDCPDAYGVLTYSQSTNPDSPHYTDNTALYSQSEWMDLPFCAEDVEAATLERMTVRE